MVSRLAKAARKSELWVRLAALQICSCCAPALLAAALRTAAGAADVFCEDQGLPWSLLLFLFPSSHLVAKFSAGIFAKHPARSQA